VVFAGLLMWGGLAGCWGFGDCHEVGCADGVTVNLRPSQGVLPSGSYAFDLAAGARTHACSFVVPDDLPELGTLTDVDCAPPLAVQIGPEAMCSEQRRGNSIDEACRPVPEHFVLQAHVEGTPPTLELRLTRDEAVLLEQVLTPSYETTRPNGPDCGPVCQEATLDVTLP